MKNKKGIIAILTIIAFLLIVIPAANANAAGGAKKATQKSGQVKAKPTPKPKATPTPKPKLKPKVTPKPKATPRPTAKPRPTLTPTPTPVPISIIPKAVGLNINKINDIYFDETAKAIADVTMEPFDAAPLGITYGTKNPELVKVSVDGIITPLGTGTAIITATCDNISAELTVNVKPRIELTAKLNSTYVSTLKKQKLEVTLATNPKDLKIPLEFTSSDNKVATVDANGEITGLTSGKTEITVKAGDKTCTVGITVYEEYTNIDTDSDGLTDYQEKNKYFTNPNKNDTDQDGVSDGDWNERKEYTYTVKTIMRVLPPCDVNNLNDDFQDARFLKNENGYIYFELINYPYTTNYEAVRGNPNWHMDNKENIELQKYLLSTQTMSFDENMTKTILAELNKAGIDIYSMTDKEAVLAVSEWINKYIKYEGEYPMEFLLKQSEDGRIYVPDTMKPKFNYWKQHYEVTFNNSKPLTEQEFIDRIIIGKKMFEYRVRQTCSSTATLWGSVMRAIGIPTRIILTYTHYDFGDISQINMAEALKNQALKDKIKSTYIPNGVGDHFLNEVYIGGHWTRLDGEPNDLGQKQSFLGRMRVDTEIDYMDFHVAEGWLRDSGDFKEPPYHADAMEDTYGIHYASNPYFKMLEKKNTADVNKNKYNSNLVVFPNAIEIKTLMEKLWVMDCADWAFANKEQMKKYNMIVVFDNSAINFSEDMKSLYAQMITNDKNYLNVKVIDGRLVAYVKAQSTEKLKEVLSKMDNSDLYIEQYVSFDK